jgi:uncharacterized membrane protein YqhA
MPPEQGIREFIESFDFGIFTLFYFKKKIPYALKCQNHPWICFPVKNMEPDGDSCQPDAHGSSMIRFITGSSKWLFTLAVLGTALISVFLFILGFLIVLYAVAHAAVYSGIDIQSLKEVLATFIEIIDVFLVATVFYIIALGFYELFIAKAPLPGWLKICNLDDLKGKLLGLVVIALSVLILGEGLTWNGTSDILGFGIAIAVGIVAISFYMWVKH